MNSNDKILDILWDAKGWLTASDVAEKGGFRSVANVGLILKGIDKAVSRKSPTKLDSRNQPLTEWKHADKSYPGDDDPLVTKPVVKANPPNVSMRNKATKPAGDTLPIQSVAGRSKTEKDLADKLAKTDGRLEISDYAVSQWQSLASEYECKSIPDLRVFITSLEQRVTRLSATVESLREQLDGKVVDAEFFPEPLPEPSGYLVVTPNKPLRRFAKSKNAMTIAGAAAKRCGIAEIYTLHPHMKAIRGVEFKGLKK